MHRAFTWRTWPHVARGFLSLGGVGLVALSALGGKAGRTGGRKAQWLRGSSGMGSLGALDPPSIHARSTAISFG